MIDKRFWHTYLHCKKIDFQSGEESLILTDEPITSQDHGTGFLTIIQVHTNREVLVMGHSVPLRLSALVDNPIKGNVEDSYFALALISAVFGQIKETDFLTFPLAETPSKCR